MIPTLLFFAAVVIGLIEEFQANGKSRLGWAVVLIGIGLLWGWLT